LQAIRTFMAGDMTRSDDLRRMGAGGALHLPLSRSRVLSKWQASRPSYVNFEPEVNEFLAARVEWNLSPLHAAAP
jgi:hypothetical protein